MGDWYKDWFASQEYLSVYNHRNESDAEKFFSLIFNHIKIPEDASVLDAACGAGRHARVLKKRGYKVFAFDLSKTLLNIASSEKDNINYVNCDIRKVPFRKMNFDLVANIFTSFGYFESDEENFKFICDSYNLIKKSGYFVFDYFNKKYLINNLVPSSERILNNKKIVENRFIRNNRVHKDIVISEGDYNSTFFESVKLYSSHEILKKFNEIGFKVEKLFGSYSGETFDEKSSERIILICSK